MEIAGTIWVVLVWVGGQVVGDPDIAEQLMHAFTPFYLLGTVMPAEKRLTCREFRRSTNWTSSSGFGLAKTKSLMQGGGGAEIFNSSANWISHASR